MPALNRPGRATSMRGWCDRLWRRSREERRLLPRVILLHTAIAITCRILPFSRLVQLLSLAFPRRSGRATREAEHAVLWAVRAVAGRLPRSSTCLTEALTAACLLRARGSAATLRIGVARDGCRGFTAHAWLERAGVVLVGGAVDQYAVIWAEE